MFHMQITALKSIKRSLPSGAAFRSHLGETHTKGPGRGWETCEVGMKLTRETGERDQSYHAAFPPAYQLLCLWAGYYNCWI